MPLLQRIRPFINIKELLVCISIFLFSCSFYFHIYNLHEPDLLLTGEDVWFQGDMPRITDNMTDRFAWGHHRLTVHPLLSLQTYPPTYVLMKLGFSDYVAIQTVSIFIAGLWSLTLYALLRIFGCVRLDAILLLMLAWSTASALFWLPTPESYALGSISIMIALIATLLALRHTLPVYAYIAASAFSMSITITNWMAGILATFTTQPRRRALTITIVTFLLVTALWWVEKQIFPNAGFFIGDDEEANYMYFPTLHRMTTVLTNIFIHTAVTPDILTLPNTHIFGEGGFNWVMVSIQEAMVGSATLQGKIASVLWALLLGLGIGSFFISRANAYKTTLGLLLLGQVSLHVLYGEETFLYSLHFLPLLLALVAYSYTNHLRAIAIAITIIFIPLSMINNWQQFKKANDIAVSPRQNVLNQIRERPLDSWSIYDTHALLALPGSLEKDKAYIEPGGSFSPSVGSFGISIWLSDSAGRFVATSDTIPEQTIQQSFEWHTETIPSITTQTPYYRSNISLLHDQYWHYKINFFGAHPIQAALLIRSVGPAGAPIHSLKWNEKELIINDEWSVTFQSPPIKVVLGEEGRDAWNNPHGYHAIESKNGWAFAKIELDTSQPAGINIHAIKSSANPPLFVDSIGSKLTVDLPDQRFADSLDAQIAHMMMGVVNNETRPGDPTNYPLSWQRDGAYILVALTKAGQIETAKALSKEFAENDFFGGFGSEADAPGLAIWALHQVAQQVNDPNYDAWLWPHIERKAQLIEKMRTTNVNFYANFKGKIVPEYIGDPNKHLVAEPSKNGLIVGSMDHHRPILFVNAISYMGLTEAATFAARVGKLSQAQTWNNSAEDLKQAWQHAFTPPNTDNERTYISALWPTWIAADQVMPLESKLTERWETLRDSTGQFKQKPLWTYFDLAEAHQWLYLGQSERTWATLEWYWQHQNAHGLYTWWEGNREENSFGIWRNIRGWVHPKSVNPHYWTAAEMALLQMDMLGYIQADAHEPTLILGSGIPSGWLDKPLKVNHLKVGPYSVDWHWQKQTMQVVIDSNQPIKVKLGKAFPKHANIIVRYRRHEAKSVAVAK